MGSNKNRDPNKLTSDQKESIRESKRPWRVDKLLWPGMYSCQGRKTDKRTYILEVLTTASWHTRRFTYRVTYSGSRHCCILKLGPSPQHLSPLFSLYLLSLSSHSPPPAILACIAAISWSLLSNIFFSHNVVSIDATDQLALRDVFFGEGTYKGSYVVLCLAPTTEDPPPPLNSAFLDASKILGGVSAGAKFVTLDCGALLPSGSTVASRFKLDSGRRPALVFVSGARLPGVPVQLQASSLKSGIVLANAIKSLLEPRTVKVESTSQLSTRCLERDYCLLLLKGGEVTQQVKGIFKELIEDFSPTVQFAHIDSSVVAMNLESSKGLEFVEGQHRLVMFRRLPSPEGKKDEKKKKKTTTTKKRAKSVEDDGEDDSESEDEKEVVATSARLYKSNDYSAEALTAFIASSLKDDESFKVLKTLPKTSIRTKRSQESAKKKKDEADKKKADYGGRVRDDNDDDGNDSAAAGGGAGATTKEERKAERERQRERARKEKEASMTPEEIQEANRKREADRRKKIEEQMKSTYVEDGEVGEGEYDDLDGGGDEDGGGGGGGGGDDEEEEVIDLD